MGHKQLSFAARFAHRAANFTDVSNVTVAFSSQLLPHYFQQVNELILSEGDGAAIFESIDNPQLPPSKITGRGNFYFTSIHQLEHSVEQLEYLAYKVSESEGRGAARGAKRRSTATTTAFLARRFAHPR